MEGAQRPEKVKSIVLSQSFDDHENTFDTVKLSVIRFLELNLLKGAEIMELLRM